MLYDTARSCGRKLNSNIGCLKMDISGKLDNTATGLNSNIGCFEIYQVCR